jgi:ketosteroid isomerase-like protein
MKHFSFLSILFLCIGCQSVDTRSGAPIQPGADIASELAAIEETRSAFQTAIKEGRYEDLANYLTADAKTVGPATDGWNEMRALGAERGRFPYDSIIMHPLETRVVSDSIAYDFGTSSVYFTDKHGAPQELQNSFLVILKKDKDGVWKLHREVASATVE